MTDTALALLASVLTALAAAVILLAIAITRTRERVVKLEEWARIHEASDRRRRRDESR